MRGANNAEVPAVERHDLRLIEAFDQCDDARIDDSEAEVRVLSLEPSAAREIGGRYGLHPVCAGENVLEEGEPYADVETLVAPVVELGEYEDRNDEILLGSREKGCARAVIGIRGVQCSKEGAGVKDERHAPPTTAGERSGER